MKKKILTVLIGITLTLTMLFGLLPACGGGGPTGQQPAASGAPVAQGEVIHWRDQTNTNAGTATYWTEQELSKTIETASSGRMILDVQPQGAIVGVMEMFDAVATGAIEMASS